MLAPRAPSAFVCLRCELKLARPRTSAPPSRSSHTNFSTTTRHHGALEDFETPSQDETPAQNEPARKPVRITKEYYRSGNVITQRKAKLGMKRMDEDADILVVNEAPKPEDPGAKQPELLEPISVPDILSALEQEDAPATQEDVARQLDSLRPVRGSLDMPHYVTNADFVKLGAALTRGFTQAQLSHYYSAAKRIKQDTVYEVVKATVKATKRSEWHPTTTSLKKRLPGVETIKGQKSKQKARKATLVDKILRDVWKLELLEEIEASGELELRLKEWELKLLQAGGNDSSLARIARTRNAKLEIHWPTRILRVTADKNTAEYTANDVEEAISKAHTTLLDLKPWFAQLDKARFPPDNNLAASLPSDYVSSLTGAHIVASDHYTLKIHGLNENSVAEARRTLIRLLPFKDSATRTIDTQKLDAAKHNCYLLPTFNDTRSLDYSYRNLNLGRWVLPVTRSTDTFPPEDQEAHGGVELKAHPEQNTYSLINRVVSLMRPPVDGSFTGSESTPRNRQTGYWYLEPEYKVSADFGQALFPLEYSDPNKVIEAASDPRSPFQPTIPGLGSLLASSEFQNLSRTETPALLYDFIPSPDQDHLECEVGSDFPKLHVQVRTGREGNRPAIHKLSLGFQERVHDILLPDQAADIRFYRYGRLRFSSKSHHDENVEEWSEAVRQNIESGGRLSAPSLTIEIPKWTIPGFPSDATGMLPIKYLFSGIQFRQSVTGRLLDTQISYSTLQSGKLGAKGGVLSAYSPNLKENQYETQIHDFATKCVQMVDYITQASAQTQPLRQIRLPRSIYSARKQRRTALQEGRDQGSNDMQNEDRRQNEDSELVGSVENAENQEDIENDDETQNFLSNQEEDARLASRLDGETLATESERTLTESESKADESKQSARSKLQEQEADALIDDLFGDEVADGPFNEQKSEKS